MAKAIGIDVNERGFKIIEAEGSAKKFKVTRLLVQDIEGHDDPEVTWDHIIEELRAVLREEKIPREPVAAALGAKDAILRDIQIPFKAPDQIKKVIRFEAENHIQHCAIEDVVVNHLKAGEVGDKSHVLVFGATKTSIEERLRTLGRCGIDPVTLDLDPLALYNAVSLTDLPEQHPSLGVLEIGAAHTSLLLLSEGHLVSARTFRLGSASINHAIRRDLHIGDAEAETKKLQLLAVGSAGGGGGGGGDVPAMALTEDHVVLEDVDEKPEIEKSPEELETELITRSRDDFLAKLHRELVRSLVGTPSVTKLDAILLAGGGSRIRGVEDYLRDNFAPTVEVFNPLDHVATDLTADQVDELGPRAAVPLGLVAKALGHDRLGMDYRQGEFKYMRRFDQIKVALASCISLILILFCFMGAFFWKQLEAAEKPYRVVEDRAVEVFDKVLQGQYGSVKDGRFEKIGSVLSKMEYAEEDLAKQLGRAGDIPAVQSAIDPLLAVFNDFRSVEKKIPGTIIDTIDIKGRLVKVTGWVPEARYLQVIKDQMLKSTKKHGLYDKVSPGPSKSTPSGLLRFDKFEILRPDTTGKEK